MTTFLSPEAYEAYIRKNETWNLTVNTLDLVFYNFALSFIYGSTILSLYANHLTSSAVLIGLIPAIQNVGYFLPQLLMARKTEQTPVKRDIVMRLSVIERLPYIFVTLGILLWPQAPNWFSFTLLAFSLAAATLAGGLAGPAWNAMLAKVIRPERRGRFFGLSQALGGLLGIAGAAVARYVLASSPYPHSYGLCFLLCFIFQAFSWVCLSLNREPAKESASTASSTGEYLKKLPVVLRQNRNFTRYLVGRSLLILGGMGGAFYIIYATRIFKVGDAIAGNLTMTALIVQTVFTPLLGWLADRRGHKWVMELGAVVSLAAVAAALLANGALWFYAVFAFSSIAGSGMTVAGMAIILDFSAPEELPTFVALANTLLAIPILLAPLVGGWIIDTLGYQTLFFVAMGFLMLGLGTMYLAVHEPRHRDKLAVAPQSESSTS